MLGLVAAFVSASLSGCAERVVYLAPEPPAHSYYAGDFHDALDPYGAWIWVEPHGWVWAPRGVPVAWRPYTHGHWVHTHDGWLWRSSWAWGWAPFHYGRWTFDGQYGWVWIPGHVWAPAWVAWRTGPGWVGWAPLPPDAYWHPGVGVVWHTSPRVHVVTHAWVFVPADRCMDRDVRVVVIHPSRNHEVVRRTHRVVRYESREGRVIHRGVGRADIERATRRTIDSRQLVDDDRPAASARRRALKRDEPVPVYRPRFDTRTRRDRRLERADDDSKLKKAKSRKVKKVKKAKKSQKSKKARKSKRGTRADDDAD
jgi:hypothetical protein